MGLSKAFEAAKFPDVQDFILDTDSVPFNRAELFFSQIYRINGKSMLRVYMQDPFHNSLLEHKLAITLS